MGKFAFSDELPTGKLANSVNKLALDWRNLRIDYT